MEKNLLKLSILFNVILVFILIIFIFKINGDANENNQPANIKNDIVDKIDFNEDGSIPSNDSFKDDSSNLSSNTSVDFNAEDIALYYETNDTNSIDDIIYRDFIIDKVKQYKENIDLDERFITLLNSPLDDRKTSLEETLDTIDKDSMGFHSISDSIKGTELCKDSEDIEKCFEQTKVLNVILEKDKLEKKDIGINQFKLLALYNTQYSPSDSELSLLVGELVLKEIISTN